MKTEHVSSIYGDETALVLTLVFTVHVSSSIDSPTLCALLAFVTTLETQKKKALPREENENRDIPAGFVKTVKFHSWHGGATRRHGRTKPE